MFDGQNPVRVIDVAQALEMNYGTCKTHLHRAAMMNLLTPVLRKQTPTVEFFGLDADPNRLSATWRVFFDYGAALGDFRAAYKSKGEA